MLNMKALLQRHKKKKEEKDKKKKGALSPPSSHDESEEVTRMASFLYSMLFDVIGTSQIVQYIVAIA